MYNLKPLGFMLLFAKLKRKKIHYIIIKSRENIMIGNILKSIFGSKNERDLKLMEPLVQAINDLEPGIQSLSDDQLKGKASRFKEKLANG